MSRPTSRSRVAWPFYWRWGPPILWMGVISLLSTDPFSLEKTSRFLLPLLHWVFPSASPETLQLVQIGVRKWMHVVEFGVLALLWYRALGWGGQGWQTKAALAAFLFAAAFAFVDEAHQTLVASRTGSLGDVAWDSLGAACSLAGWRVIRR